MGTGAAAGARAGRGRRYVSEEAMLQYAIHMSLMEQRAQQGASGPEGQQGGASQPQVVPGEVSLVDAALLVPDEVDESALLQQAIAASLALQQGAGGATGGAETVEALEAAAPATERSPAVANAVPAEGARPQIIDRRAARQSGRVADKEQLRMVLELSMACSLI